MSLNSKKQIQRALDCNVEAVDTPKRIHFTVRWKNSKGAFYTSYGLWEKEIHRISCSCWWFTNMTMNNKKYCYHAIAMRLWLAHNSIIPKWWLKKDHPGLIESFICEEV